MKDPQVFEVFGLPMDITDYELKKVLPTQAQLAKCYADAEARRLTRSEDLACIMGAGGAFASIHG